ncbi:GNAT family N-acetyltransferase [Massilia sp. H6]|uniref:GNAT family N-acetyltransferase n=1 Tax=Massilia sp. H6 TaxID=2970464 RepID=UPI00216A7F68|nr:GNAT family N-acetyltransferase [Massilia sp. H6]UVW28848.1 GNAT family N-acetyltransferase [Massilia sp. H6]
MIDWQFSSFNDLGPADLYALLAQRQQVFILEQTCLYPDIDGLDPAAHHLLGWRTIGGERQLVAYLRVLGPGAKYDEMSLGRVLTTQAARGSGAGRALLARGIDCAEALYPGHRIRIGAQRYLEKFYQSFGFATVSAPYDEDGIEHIDMLR